MLNQLGHAGASGVSCIFICQIWQPQRWGSLPPELPQAPSGLNPSVHPQGQELPSFPAVLVLTSWPRTRAPGSSRRPSQRSDREVPDDTATLLFQEPILDFK